MKRYLNLMMMSLTLILGSLLLVADSAADTVIMRFDSEDLDQIVQGDFTLNGDIYFSKQDEDVAVKPSLLTINLEVYSDNYRENLIYKQENYPIQINKKRFTMHFYESDLNLAAAYLKIQEERQKEKEETQENNSENSDNSDNLDYENEGFRFYLKVEANYEKNEYGHGYEYLEMIYRPTSK